MNSTPSEPNETHGHSSEPRLLTRVDAGTEAATLRLYQRLDWLQRAQARKKMARPKRRILRKIFIAGGVIACLVLMGMLVCTFWLRHEMRASLPQLDGTIRAEGLTAAVTVTRDAQGVPTLRAAGLDDLLFAQGFVTAQDRLFQMDALRRHAAGELAEVLGPSLVDHDRLQRTLQIRAAAERALAVMQPDQLHQLEVYARGVNAFIDGHRDTLPVEFHLLHYAPASWTPRDSLLVSLAMSQDLSTEFPTKLAREKLSAHLPAELLADLYPSGSFRDVPPTQPALDLTAPQEEIEQIPLDRSQSSVTPQDLLRFTTDPCEDCRAGSNNWAVAGTRSATGAPLLSNDMHLALNVPDIWYEAGLHVADAGQPLDVVGFTLPGVPFVIVGRNAHVAWGFTAMVADVQDLRVEHLRGEGARTEFQRSDRSWSLVEHHAEQIHVRGGRDVKLDVMTTRHTLGDVSIETPVISALYPSERRAISLSWNLYDPANVNSPFLAIDTAADGASLVAAFASFGSPSLNLVYADQHHIGYHALGRLPIRGPAVQRPRTLPELVLPGSLPAGDDEEDEGSTARVESTTRMIPANYRVAARRRFGPSPMPVGPKPVPMQKPVVTPPPRNYTIGSPIAPVPTDALDASQDWSGYIAFNELPSLVDPPGGVLATANARVAADDYPYFLANDWVDPYRVERIHRSLTARTELTATDMLALQNDVHSEFDLVMAQHFAYAIDHASGKALAGDAMRLHEAADILRSWDGELTGGSPAAAIVSASRAEFWPMLLTPAIRAHDHAAKDDPALAQLYVWAERNTALELMLQHTPARWLPAAYASWNDLLTAAVAAGLKHGNAPRSLAKWQYGANHTVEIAHPIFGSHGVLSRVLGVPTGSGAQPAGGDSTTVKAIGQHFGPSERFTADLANAEATMGNITTGQAGNPASEWYLDQFVPWLRGTTFALPLVHPNEVHVLTLTPK